MKIHFLDSSVFCNLLAIPGKSDRAGETKAELDLILKNKERERIILPFATIIETGNHISHISDGNVRYNTAKRFCTAMLKTIAGEAPWTYYGAQLTEADIENICSRFPETVKHGMGVGDLSIIRAYERYKDETPAIEEIRIWTYDNHLAQFHETMSLPPRRRR